MYIIIGHENPDVDSIVSGVLLEKYLKRKGYLAQFIISDQKIEEETLIICEKYGLFPREYQGYLPKDNTQKYILVDHHEREVPGKVVGVIDHHPTYQKFSCSYYRNEKASSTASMIVKGREQEFDKEEIVLAIVATLVDTVSFHSSKTLQEDISWVKRMAKEYQLSYSSLYQEGLCLTDIKSLDTFLYHGLKEYQFKEEKVASSSVLLLHPEDYQVDYPDIFLKIQNYMKQEKLYLFVLLIHDMTKFQSSAYYIEAELIQKREFNHFVSRGSEIIPELEKRIFQKS